MIIRHNRQFRTLSLGSWRWQTALDCEMLSSPECYLLGFPRWLRAWPLFTLLNLLDLAWSSKFLQPEQNFFNQPVTILLLTVPSSFAQQMFLVASATYGQIRTRKAWVPIWVSIARSSMRLLNHSRCEAMHNVSAHQLPRYYQLHRLLNIVWTD